MRILVVEDDKDLSSAMVHILEHAGYEVDSVYDGEDGLAYAESGIYDAVVFDVMLPKMDGFDAVEELRCRQVKVPVLMLTARNTVHDKIEGLDSGADSYMTKPFSPKELLARLRALTRRQSAIEGKYLECGDLKLSLNDRTLACNDESVRLSNKEFLLAELFMDHAGMHLSRSQIAERVWSADSCVTDNNIEAYVAMLRKKLKFLDSSMKIRTERNIGYVFEEGRD